LNPHLQSILNFIQQSQHLSAEEKTALSKAAKAADKELEITSFKLERTEKVKHTTAILLEETIEELEHKRKAVEAQNRELEIESSLERVRTVAMSMNKPDDLLRICEILFTELHALGFEELRNAMINIYDDDKVYFLNYDYAPGPGKTVTHIPYNFHPLINKQVNETKNAGDAFIEFSFSDQELRDFRELRKNNGEQDDPKLDDCSSLHYYFYSFGTGSIGISAYNAITDEKKNVLKRFRNVFDLAYKRYVDITNAEAQAKEAQVQLALERVRARTMAMQKSDELSEAVYILFNQFKELGEKPDQATIGIINEKEWVIEYWVTMYGNQNNKVYKFSLDEPNVTNKIYKAWKENKSSLVIDLSGDALSEFMLYRAGKGGAAINPNEKRRIINVAFFSKGLLNVQSNEERSKESIQLLERFAMVFEQTYTRFLDLQKAETQAREAQIEAALEKVRSRTMAMQKQNDLLGVLDLLVEQLVKLGVNLQVANFSNGIAGGDWNLWIEVAADDGTIFNNYVHFPRIDHPYFHHVEKNIETFRKDGTDLFKDVFSKEEKDSWQDYINTQTIYKDLTSEEIKQLMYEKPGYAWSMVILKDTWVSICRFNTIPFSDEEDALLRRFANAFGQTYTRFLDLQKAEAQAREAKIETALEKVRSCSLAMHKSEDIQHVVHELYTRLLELNIRLDSANILFFKEGSRDIECWTGSYIAKYQQATFPYADYDFLKEINEAHENGSELLKSWYTKEKKDALFKYFFEETELKSVPEERKKFVFSGQHHACSVALVQNICINLNRYFDGPFSDEEDSILKRFAKVFHQAYTRFLDLEKAEAQAREAQIEAALERVRSRTMGMQHSDELQDAAVLMFQQIESLGVAIIGCGFNIWDEDRKEATAWMSGLDRIQPPFKTSGSKDIFLRINEAAERGESLFVEEQAGEELVAHYQYMASIPVFRKILEGLEAKGLSAPSHQVMNCTFFSQGYLMFITPGPAESAYDIFKRFAKVFEQTYTRFLDLQKAEAQALEAIKRASVDRVRAEIASMRTTNDLERITPIVWNELTTLGVPFIRCGVFIMDEEQERVHTFLSTPDGKAIATLHVPFDFDLPLIANGVDHWHNGEIYREHWDAATFIKSWTALSALSETSTASPQNEHPPENLYLHQLPFLQGMLYVGSEGPLTEDELQLSQNLADAFSTAYARYEDFNKLEAAKKQVDSALNELQATQKQLVQSEKMASLGELTAGIAHEIQNPLNFVNNFSEVSNELLSEMVDEANNGNIDEVKAIANDVQQNLEKILHHGKRADAIVKGMLQHSRSSAGVKEPTDINALADEYLRLSYHGLRAKDKSFNAEIKTNFDESIGKINIIPQDIGRVLLNLFNNAFYVVNEQKSRNLNSYEPTVSVSTKKVGDNVEITVSDNGCGIPQKIVNKIFQPFFTTKPTGQGTGLGLSLSYDIVKAHGGEIKVETREGGGSEFIIQLPVV
jgi:signal transduction histidine kinase